LNSNPKLPIGIFDSGIGGLTVVRQIHKVLPHEDLIYLGDTARVPYGTKSPSTVTRFACEDTRFLLQQGVKAVVVACNKIDLPSRLSAAELQAALAKTEASGETTAADAGTSDSVLHPSGGPAGEVPVEVIWTSALTGQGLHHLREKILEVAAPARDLGPEGQFITNLRHQRLIKESLAALTRARDAASKQIPHEMLLLDLYDALRPLDQITGATYVDDLLNIIFSTFCVGK